MNELKAIADIYEKKHHANVILVQGNEMRALVFTPDKLIYGFEFESSGEGYSWKETKGSYAFSNRKFHAITEALEDCLSWIEKQPEAKARIL